MTKIKTIPKGARSQGWMGPPSLSGYTIQADVFGAEKDEKMPDIGLIGQRYTLDMMGASQAAADSHLDDRTADGTDGPVQVATEYLVHAQVPDRR